MPPRLLIATPTPNGLLTVDYVTALVALVGRLHAAGIAVSVHHIDGPSLDVQRDMAVARFRASDATHLLLVDGDVGFAPELCEQLLACDRPVVGAVCPVSAPRFDGLADAVAARGIDAALALSRDWSVRFPDRTVTVERGLCAVAHLDPAFLLIRRDCIERLVADGHAPPYRDDHGPLHAVFRDIPAPGRPLERRTGAFCRRWVAAGGTLWAFAEARAHRVCDHAYGMPFRRFVAALRDAADAPAPRPEADPGPEA